MHNFPTIHRIFINNMLANAASINRHAIIKVAFPRNIK